MLRFVFLWLNIICIFSVEADISSISKGRPTVCLNMIVKNEKDVIERCLQSVSGIIDYWVIVDTGSTDGTQEIIKEFMKKKSIKGELHERPWKNFSHNRNEALRLAKNKGDYTFFIDADEYLVYEKDFQLPLLDKDYYYITVSHGSSRYGKIQFIRSSMDWEWVGVLHEFLRCPLAKSCDILKDVENIYTTEGARSKDPLKYEKDAEILEAALKEEPNNQRYVFYLAQSYRDAGNYQRALDYYKKRIEMRGWDQEIYYSLYQIASIKEQLNYPFEEVLESYFQSFLSRPSRAEPLYRISSLYRKQGRFDQGYQIAKYAAGIRRPDDLLFVEDYVYRYGILLEQSICAYWVGNYEESHNLSLRLLEQEKLPSNVRECVRKNLEFVNVKLVEQILKSDQAAMKEAS
jgi:glycosyltransferase involved in cell wall biosynthesis